MFLFFSGLLNLILTVTLSHTDRLTIEVVVCAQGHLEGRKEEPTMQSNEFMLDAQSHGLNL